MIEHEYLEAIILNQYVIGADEVGRGCFAGPIVGCAVKISSKDTKAPNRSERLKETKRKEKKY